VFGKRLFIMFVITCGKNKMKNKKKKGKEGRKEEEKKKTKKITITVLPAFGSEGTGYARTSFPGIKHESAAWQVGGRTYCKLSRSAL
jgi:hypothetical protein